MRKGHDVENWVIDMSPLTSFPYDPNDERYIFPPIWPMETYSRCPICSKDEIPIDKMVNFQLCLYCTTSPRHPSEMILCAYQRFDSHLTLWYEQQKGCGSEQAQGWNYLFKNPTKVVCVNCANRLCIGQKVSFTLRRPFAKQRESSCRLFTEIRLLHS